MADLEPLPYHNYQPKSMETSTLLTLWMLENFTKKILFDDFFLSKLSFSKHPFPNTLRLKSNVGPGLRPNCLQRLSADGTK